jgi:hypothetical protein
LRLTADGLGDSLDDCSRDGGRLILGAGLYLRYRHLLVLAQAVPSEARINSAHTREPAIILFFICPPVQIFSELHYQRVGQ